MKKNNTVCNQQTIKSSFKFVKIQENLSTNRKKGTKIRERIQPIEKRNKSDDALAFFENSNEIQ